MSTSLQIGGGYGTEDEMVMLGQAGNGQWQQLGGSSDGVDGRRELEGIISEVGSSLEQTYRWQAICAARIPPDEFMKSPLRNLGDRVIALKALGIMRQIATLEDAGVIEIAQQRLTDQLKPVGFKTTEKVPPKAMELYEHLMRKYEEKWKNVSDAIMRWAKGTCDAGSVLMSELLGVEGAGIGCAADLSALICKGAVRRETLGTLVIKCTNGRCTRINLKPEVASQIKREFRQKFYQQTGRPAGIASGTYSKLPIIDIGYFPKERALTLIGGYDSDNNNYVDPMAERDM
jgi:hypothetical protein